jgi:type I restriction enzyme, S subunit
MSGATFARYEGYKDSGFEWLGEIPSHWEIKRLKELTKLIIDGTHFTPDYKDEGIHFLSVNDITRKIFDLNQSKFISYEAHQELIKRCRPKKGDILLSKNGTIGIPFLIDFDDEVSIYVSLCLLKLLSKMDGRYCYYAFLSSFMFEQYNLHSKMNSVNNLHLDKLRNFYQLSLPLAEQTAIAAYLDTKTAQIDREIDLLTQKVTQYGKLKVSVINEAVTRGLDKTVRMKDSGVEWIGEVPEHWEVRRIKDFSRSINGGAFRDGLSDSGIPIIKIRQLTLQCEPVEFCDPHFFKVNSDNKIKDGDLLFSWSTLIYPFIYTGVDALLNQHIFKIECSKNICKKWFYYKLIQSADRLTFFAHGSTMQHILKSDFDNLEIEMPSLEEQNAIAAYLDTKTAQIDTLTQALQAKIEKLKELRKTLINDVVTGKIKVI